MEPILTDRRILIAVGGGIAAYKAAELVRLCKKAGAEVRVAMTEAATRFVGPLTFAALSQAKVATDLFDLQEEASIGHIALADWAEILVVAPATADLLAKLAHGFAGDVVTALALACRAPLLIAPAMNINMWQHAATRDNLERLKARGALTVGPFAGELACGWVGQGRLAEPSEMVRAVAEALGPRDWEGLGLLVTAGPTHEALDPVRFIGNRSTGKMGFAIAQAAAQRGARVLLVAGPTALATPPGVERIDVESARQMQEAVLARAEGQAAIVKAAAVADHRPRSVATHKLKKEAGAAAPPIELELNPDILAELGARSWKGRRPVLVGFAAETEELEPRAVDKLRRKGCDLLVANDVSEPGSGFGSETNRVILVGRDGQIERLPLAEKSRVAARILDRVRALVGAAP